MVAEADVGHSQSPSAIGQMLGSQAQQLVIQKAVLYFKGKKQYA